MTITILHSLFKYAFTFLLFDKMLRVALSCSALRWSSPYIQLPGCSPQLINGYLMPTTWILLTLSHYNLIMFNNISQNLLNFSCLSQHFVFAGLCIIWLSFTLLLTLKYAPLQADGFLLISHTCHLLPLDLYVFLSLHPEVLPSPLHMHILHILKVQFKFYLVSTEVPDYSCNIFSLYSEFLSCYALYYSAFSDMLSPRTGCPYLHNDIDWRKVRLYHE